MAYTRGLQFKGETEACLIDSLNFRNPITADDTSLFRRVPALLLDDTAQLRES